MGKTKDASEAVILTFRVTPDQAREARLAAKVEGTSVSEFIRRAVRSRTETLVNGEKVS